MSAHVDDVLIGCPESEYPTIIDILKQEFSIKEGPKMSRTWSPFLGREWRLRDEHALQVRVKVAHYNDTILMMGLTGCKPASTPEVKITIKDVETPLSEVEHRKFRSLVGRLYSNTDVRVEIQTAIREIARACAAPTDADMMMLKHLIRYLEGTTNYALNLENDDEAPENEILTHVDAA